MKMNIKELNELGSKYNAPFYLPPFDKNIRECFFDINKIKKKPIFQEFIDIIHTKNIKYEYAKRKGSRKIFMVIDIGQLDGFQ